MAYTRWSDNCDLYSYWIVSKAKAPEEEMLAFWIRPTEHPYLVSYRRCKKMLMLKAFDEIPGYNEKYYKIIIDDINEFIKDVDEEYKNN